ncbi:MAG TPA: phosphoribosylamine--glycine ligase [Chitinophagaceae bacterium]|jgi:phosphoribosylamine--glycine ligase|nr:phosphoribosylamine--glycine ligase [Chitinophagaceae bacterium]
MRVLLLGAGGREHAFAWKISQSPLCEKLFTAPGNAGTSQCGTNLDFGVNDFDAIKKCCIDEKIDLVLVGPEEPLVKGITDFLISDPQLKDLDIIGPSKNGAQLEGSKAFAKAFMQKYKIPTAAYGEFTLDNYKDGVDYINKHALPIVLKADGLAAGKGVVICENYVEALAEFELMIQRAKFGDASKKVVIEEFLHGIELSVFALTDGKNYVLLPEAKDYKRVGEEDTGPNTGGMGAVSPVPFADEIFLKNVEEKVIKPTIKGLKAENLEYRGFIFFGLIKVGDEPYVIEYNCRMGDPETEVVIPRLKNDFLEMLVAAAKQELNKIKIEEDDRFACTVMAVSGGYPGEYEKGYVIHGLDKVDIAESILFHAGTVTKDEKAVTNGGRVLCITSFGNSIFEAVEKSKEELQNISFTGMSYRRDIGYEFE